ncbi:FliH/SctL family protein [Sphingomonas sp. H39-1-10]|uniref:FliH/SctL family protein n=1 Tax=Sphingomonas pollutisoli TaxID=3030829 RepID=UPI0023B9BA4A|nr:FliH/SctL family protein [Sphingomonas pollutisoli]MDF0490011.1 FliH/SctL family protein [Sphingomonas pollutisoli]
MTFYFLHNDGAALIATDQPVIRAGDAGAIAEARDLLATVRAYAADTAARVAAETQAAIERGRAEGFADGRARFVAAIAELTAQATRREREREGELAALALAAVRQMLGAIGDAAVTAGLACRAVAAVAPGGTITVEVPPALQQPVIDALADHHGDGAVQVVADAALEIGQCRVSGADGRIIADLGVQLAALAERWELADVA